MGKLHKSMQGRMVDMEKLMNQNELMPAIGNIKVNARGDELGQGGKIVKKREDVMAEYYENNPKAQPNVRAKSTASQKKAAVQEKSTPITPARNSNETFDDEE